MSITPQDVHHLIDHNRDNRGLPQHDVSRIVRVLNAHRHPTAEATAPGADALHNALANTGSPASAERPGSS
ncbi:hypothetical protein [Humibacillus sp. DSM 29435]|uniref:hypothetical protein n=1 Tax=Humibacillus sp. DSM 29435 TaxID=1869167 RepID=UPI001113136A|nr:hypothetical protein [Humibacillus sp. DSM 29435]